LKELFDELEENLEESEEAENEEESIFINNILLKKLNERCPNQIGKNNLDL